MKKLTKQDAQFVVNQIFRSEVGCFYVNQVKRRFGPTLKSIHFSSNDNPFMAYALCWGAETWEEALDIARTRYTVKGGEV